MIRLKSKELGRGRIFVLSLSSGESVKDSVESFCKSNGISCARLSILGGIQAGSTFVVGPHLVDGKETAPISPMTYTTDAPTEFAGVGTVFPDQKGEPVMHLHGSLGRNGLSVTGCFRKDAKAWLTLEVVLEELLGDGIVRKYDDVLKVSPIDIQ